MARNYHARKQVIETILNLPLTNAFSYRQIQNHTSKIKCSEQSRVRAISELVLGGRLTVERGYFNAPSQVLAGGIPNEEVRFKIVREKLGFEVAEPKVFPQVSPLYPVVVHNKTFDEAFQEAKRLAETQKEVFLTYEGIQVPISPRSTVLGVIMYAGKRLNWQFKEVPA